MVFLASHLVDCGRSKALPFLSPSPSCQMDPQFLTLPSLGSHASVPVLPARSAPSHFPVSSRPNPSSFSSVQLKCHGI